MRVFFVMAIFLNFVGGTQETVLMFIDGTNIQMNIAETKVSRLRRLLKRSSKSKYKKMTAIKEACRARGWDVSPSSGSVAQPNGIL